MSAKSDRTQKSLSQKPHQRTKRRLGLAQGNPLDFQRLEDRNLLATITVTNATDLTNADTSSITALIANDGGDGISLREAIVATNNTFGEDSITFDSNVFTGGVNSLIRLTQGELEITETLTIDASMATDVTITGDANGDDVTLPDTFITDVDASFSGAAGEPGDLLDDNFRVFNFFGLYDNHSDLTLQNLTLTGGRTTYIMHSGGGIRFNSEGTLTISQSTVAGNSTLGARAGGGGIATLSGEVLLTNSLLSQNSTHGDSSPLDSVGGGGIFSDSGNVTFINSEISRNSTYGEMANGGGIGVLVGNVVLNNSLVSENSTYGGDARGGGIFTERGNIALTTSFVSENSTYGGGADGGGIAIGGFFEESSLSLENSTVSGNSTSGDRSEGGGIASEEGVVTLVDSVVAGNSTTGDASAGGGIYTKAGIVSIAGSTISGNSTIGVNAGGGGLFAFSRSRVYVANSTVSGNSTAGERSDGGGITGISGINLYIASSTVTNNRAIGSLGGGIYGLGNRTSLRLQNSIVAGNSDEGTAPDLFGFNEVFVDFSLIADATGSGVDQTTGTRNILNQPALLAPLADNGGPTLTHALRPGSPAIDAGSNAMTVDLVQPFVDTSRFFDRVHFELVDLTNDQRGDGFDRIKFGRVDIGAFESDFDAPPIAPSVLSVTIDEGGVLARPDLWNTLTVVFDADVSVAAEDLSLFNDSLGGTEVDLTGIGFSYDSTANTATWDLSTLDPLDAGFYTYRLDATAIVGDGLALDGDLDGTGGDDYVQQHYVAIPGDANLDGVVDVLGDAFALVANLGSTTNLPWADGNFNDDGTVDVLDDAFLLVGNLGRDVRPPVAASSFAKVQSQTTDSAFVSLGLAGDREEKVEISIDSDQIVSQAEKAKLVLVGDQTLRDEVFGSDF